MNIEEKKLIKEETKELLCVSCQRFYGNPAFNQMCSQCYKKYPLCYSETNRPSLPKRGKAKKWNCLFWRRRKSRAKARRRSRRSIKTDARPAAGN